MAYESLEVIKAMAETGNPNSVSDAGVGALAITACIRGAFLNVKINAAGLDDKAFVEEVMKRAEDIEKKALNKEVEILEIVNGKIKEQ